MGAVEVTLVVYGNASGMGDFGGVLTTMGGGGGGVVVLMGCGCTGGGGADMGPVRASISLCMRWMVAM